MMKNLFAPLLCALLLAGPVIEGTAEAREAAPTAFDPVAHKRVVEARTSRLPTRTPSSRSTSAIR